MATLESKGYIASDADIATLARSIIVGVLQAEGGRRDYLKVLLASTIDALGEKPRVRAGRPGKLDEAQAAKQMETLEATHARFYAIILKETTDAIPAGKDKANEANRRTAYARVAMSRLRAYAREGHDLTVLPPSRVTRDMLAVKASAKPRAVSGNRLKARAERESKTLIATLLGLADADKAAAVAELQLIMGQLSSQLVELGTVASTKDAEQAAREHIPLRIGKTLFVPTETQVIRQASRPS
jgi:hypothetical protein